MSQIEIYDPPKDGLVDVKVHGYMASSDTYLVVADGLVSTPVEIPASKISVVPDDYEDNEDYAYGPWEDIE